LNVVPSSAAADDSSEIVLFADRDDDDANGVPDGNEETLSGAARMDLVPLDGRFIGATVHPLSGGDRARLIVDGRPHPWDKAIPKQAFLQGLAPGRATLVATRGGKQTTLELDVRGLSMRDGGGNRVDMAQGHASLERMPPVRVGIDPDARYEDFDALRVVLEAPARPGVDSPGDLAVESLTPAGVRLDAMARVPLAPAACNPASQGVRCWASAPLRFVADDVDRSHPLVADRSLKAEIGGAIVVRVGGRKAQAIRVLGPRTSPAGPIGRLKATVRPFVVRVAPGGAPAIGGNDPGAVHALRAELASAAAVWGQCGLTFGDPRALEVKVVDPPSSHLLAIGDDVGLVASGGEIRVRIDGRAVTVSVAAGATPDRVAYSFARAAEKAGFVAVISPNARIGPGASGSVDVSVRRKDGSTATLDTASSGAPVTTDPTLSVRIGSVDLSDGLHHFTDMDAMAGTLEERTLLKALDDGDPRTLEVVVVPLFAGGGRIGESFIGSDLSSLRNVVLLDRAGVRARKSSLTLAHELGHVLMDMPGHPDDFGVDTPTLLMDSDASDASPFGPRRITLDECARVVREAGPKARVPLLTEWPLSPIPYELKPPPALGKPAPRPAAPNAAGPATGGASRAKQ
jgi:hypothetical protein